MKKSLVLLLALALIFAFPVTASAAETTEARVPVTLTVVNTVSPISCTVPAALPVSLVDGYVVCANNAAITNTGKDGAFPAIAAEKNLAIRYKAKVSASETVANVNAATVIFTIAAVSEKEAA